LRIDDEVNTVEEVTLKNGGTQNLIFNINTADMLPGEYQISLGDLHKQLTVIATERPI